MVKAMCMVMISVGEMEVMTAMEMVMVISQVAQTLDSSQDALYICCNKIDRG